MDLTSKCNDLPDTTNNSISRPTNQLTPSLNHSTEAASRVTTRLDQHGQAAAKLAPAKVGGTVDKTPFLKFIFVQDPTDQGLVSGRAGVQYDGVGPQYLQLPHAAGVELELCSQLE